MLSSLIRRLRKMLSRTQPLITVSVSASAILHNLRTFAALNPTMQVAPVLKSNAYGHGLVEVARILDRERVPFFVLDSLHEALTLRSHRIHTPLLIIGYTPAANIAHATLTNTAYTVTSLDHLRAIVEIHKPVSVHLKLDTGMHRQGIPESDWSEALSILKQNPRITVQGLCSHFADADNENPEFTHAQIRLWNSGRALFAAALPTITYFHIAATAGARFHTALNTGVLRLGLGLYGIDAVTKSTLALKPALQIETIIAGIKEIHAGDSVGYNATYTAPHPMRIATIPMGYFEGIDRRLSNKGCVLVHGIPCPIIGRVSMNITSIDVSSVPTIALGDSVLVIAVDDDAPNTVARIAKTSDTIPWEILVHIPQHLRREVVA